jgi:GNAT superfamily N-acetyltransferase
MYPTVTIRKFLCERDSASELTLLLNRAYKKLADMGLRFVATYQDESITRERMRGSECYVALVDGRLVGTILYRDPSRTKGCPWYDGDGVASFGQYAVDPTFQGSGLGSALLQVVEQRARDCGAFELALDTAEPAEHLIKMYEAKGYRIVERVQWDVTNYLSVVMSKTLGVSC